MYKIITCIYVMSFSYVLPDQQSELTREKKKLESLLAEERSKVKQLERTIASKDAEVSIITLGKCIYTGTCCTARIIIAYRLKCIFVFVLYGNCTYNACTCVHMYMYV